MRKELGNDKWLEEKTYKDIAYRVKNQREFYKLTQNQLAEMVGYESGEAIERIETTGYGITQDKVPKLSKVLKVMPSSLMYWGVKDVSDFVRAYDSFMQSYGKSTIR